MIVFNHSSAALGNHHLDRREWLRVGSLGIGGLALPQLLHARDTIPTAAAKKPKSVILLFLLGAPPQQETWDHKPDSPAEFRGDMKTIETVTPGLRVGEMMTETAKWTNQIAVLRAMSTGDNAHSSSGYYMTTGIPHAPTNVENQRPGAPNDFPSLGAVVRKFKKDVHSLPSAITLPEQAENDGNITWPGQDAGFLGRKFDPWLIHTDPSSPKFEMPGLGLPTEISTDRFDQRQQLLTTIEQRLQKSTSSEIETIYQARTKQAFDLIASPGARKAFNINEEDPKLRDRYGRTRFGQSCLLARRLVEAGVSLIRVNWTRVPNAPNSGHWDTHSKNTEGVRGLMPILDRAYTALLQDLSDRGLLDDTLVIWTGEFGRTPKINGAGGRDHWGAVGSLALAGGGVKGGQVIGSSDKIAAYPKDGKVTPQDLHATIFHVLGLDPQTEIHDNVGRPLPISRGEVITKLF